MQNETTNLENEINDLEMNNAEDIKGGPSTQSKRDVILKSSVVGGQDDDDTLRGFTLNHNETVSEENEADTQKLVDLTMDDEIESAIKGGLLPAVQKVRNAAVTAQSTGGGYGAGKVVFSDIS
jgi:hypothetical protein